MKRHRILHVLTRLPMGGVEGMLYKVITNYDRRIFDPLVCCIKEGGEIAERLTKEGYRVFVLGRMKGHGFDTGAVTEIYRILKEEKIDVLRTHQYHANLYGRIAGILAGVPVMIPSFHNLYVSPDKPKFHRRLINRLLAVWSDYLVAVSTSVAEDIKRFDKVPVKKIRVIYNGVAIDSFKVNINKEDARRSFGLPMDKWVIGSVGRLTDQKGHKYLIEAVSGMEDVVVAIAGDGPLRAVYEMVGKRRGVDCRILGPIETEKIPLFLRALDIFCCPSLWEGLPSALIEAMASGLPIIASDIPPHREVLDDTGIYFSPYDHAGLSDALKELIDNPSRRHELIHASVNRACRFSIEKTVKEYELLFEECLRKKGLL